MWPAGKTSTSSPTAERAHLTAQAPPAETLRLERRARDMRRWRRRSLIIAAFRRLLPLVILGIALAFGGWVLFGGLFSGGAGRSAAPSSIHMTNARFLGRDAQGHAYVLTAIEAARDNTDFQKITLTRPALSMDSDGQKPTQLSADHGVYREDNRILLLDGHVSVRDSQGDSFVTDQAIVDTVNGAVAGKSPIVGQGPMGSIRADSYAVYDRGRRLVFQGKVHSRLNAH
jgi:lipopolysaccharide export system protein LptC